MAHGDRKPHNRRLRVFRGQICPKIYRCGFHRDPNPSEPPKSRSGCPSFLVAKCWFGSTSTTGSYQSRDPISKLSTVPERQWSEVLCEIFFFWKKTVITLNQKLTYQNFSNSNYQKTVREMRSRTRKPRSRVGGGTSPSHTKKRRLKVISFGKRRFKHPRLS